MRYLSVAGGSVIGDDDVELDVRHPAGWPISLVVHGYQRRKGEESASFNMLRAQIQRDERCEMPRVQSFRKAEYLPRDLESLALLVLSSKLTLEQ